MGGGRKFRSTESSFPTASEAYRFLGEGKNAASLKQIRAALSFAYKHWDLKNPLRRLLRSATSSSPTSVDSSTTSKSTSRATAPPSRAT